MENPNSHKHPTLQNCWSELPQDLFFSVLDRLGFPDIRRAKSVCSSWYSASRQLVTKNHVPCLILFPDEDDDNNNSCTLFNPGEQDKLYKRQNMGVEFPNSFCLATYGTWVLMRDTRYHLYILNLFTRETINLPNVDSQLGTTTTKLERTPDECFRISRKNYLAKHKGIDMKSPVFWIDDKTKDYLVVWGFGVWCVVYSKKGDYLWNQIPVAVDFWCAHMVYKNQSLYLLDRYGTITILDLSGEVPQQTFQCSVIVNKFEAMYLRNIDQPPDGWRVSAAKLVVTVTGGVLKVEKMTRYECMSLSFRVYKKVYSSGVFMKYEQVYSLGHEAMLLDIGITVLANDVEGFKRNSIYFNHICRDKSTTAICLFNLETQKMETLHKFECSSTQQLARSRWFLPSFTQT